MPTETHRAERGHDFYPPAAELATIPPLYGIEHTPSAAKIIYGHWFLYDCDWWIVELQPDTGQAFGYACLHGDDTGAEWGYIDLTELEALYQPGHVETGGDGRAVRILPRLIVERDLHWIACTTAQADLPGWRATA